MRPKQPTMLANRYRSPAKRACFLIEFMCYLQSLLVQSYHYFSSSVPLFQVTKSVRSLTQFVSPVDDGYHFSGLHEIAEDGDVFLGQFGNIRHELLAHEP